jgi:enamine deaminase RidA (YjgF/YER057c/UK114 family)
MRRRSRSGSPFEDRYGFSRAMRVGERVLVAGTAPVPADGEPLAKTAGGQMLRCSEIAVAALQEMGAAPGDVVRTRMFITDPGVADEVGAAHAEVFGAARPVATMVVVAGLLDPGWLVELEVEAIIGDGADLRAPQGP